MYSSTAEYIEEKKKSELDFENYSDEQIIIVQRLRNLGFIPTQINALNALITMGCSFEEITQFFNCNMAVDDIQTASRRLSEIKKQHAGG